jgi:hypothetical protein
MFHASAFQSRCASSRMLTYIQILFLQNPVQCPRPAFLEVPVIGRVEGKCPYVNKLFFNAPPRGLSPLATSGRI